MKLLVSHASPYARKCRITALEKGIEGIEEVHVNPVEQPEKLNHINHWVKSHVSSMAKAIRCSTALSSAPTSIQLATGRN